MSLLSVIAGEVSDFFWGCIWNNVKYALRVSFMSQQFDAVGLTVGVTAMVLAGLWIVRRWRRRE